HRLSPAGRRRGGLSRKAVPHRQRPPHFTVRAPVVGPAARRRARPKQGAVAMILILTAHTGAGHRSVARAPAAALMSQPAARRVAESGVRVVNAFALAGHPGLLDGAVCSGYAAAIVHAPTLWGAFYRATDHPWLFGPAAAGPARALVRDMAALLRTSRP